MTLRTIVSVPAVLLLLGVAQPDSCNEPSGVPCGDQTCNTGEYCEVVYPGVPGGETTYACVLAPDSCQGDQLTCDCLVETDTCPEMVAWCEDDGAGPVCSFAMP